MRVHHMVLLTFKTPNPDWTGLCQALSNLRQRLPGIVHFSAGPYASSEGLNQGFTHGFLMTFASAADRDRYLVHPEHEKVKERFLPQVANVVAFDFEEESCPPAAG